MKTQNSAPKTVDEYIQSFNPEDQRILQEIRQIIKQAAPQAEERISYQMPGYFQNGPLAYFALAKNYLGFYPTASPIQHFSQELKDYTQTKGSVHIPLDKPLPADLIKQMVQFKLEENKVKGKPGAYR